MRSAMWVRAGTGIVLHLVAVSVFAQSPAMRKAELEMGTGQYSRAESGLSAALATDPRNGSIWFLLGVSRAQQKKIDPAIAAFETALPLVAEQAPVRFNLGLLYLEKKDLAKAEEAYSRGLALDGSNIPANQNYAFVLTQQGKFRDALVPLARLKGLRPDDVSARAALIQAYIKAGMTSRGETEIDELLSSRFFTLPQGLALTKLLIADGELDPAQRIFESLRSSWPRSADVHGELGLLFAKKEQFSEAAVELGQAVQLDPDSVRFSVVYGEALIDAEQYPVAREFLMGAKKRFANQLTFPYELALADICLQRFSDAISELESVEREGPGLAKVQFLLGGAYELQGDFTKAETAYRRAIQRTPQDSSYYRLLGSLLQKQGPTRLSEATQLSRRALALDPSDAENKIALARCLEKQGELDEAGALLEQAVGSNPDSRRAHTALAALYRRQKKLEQAEREQSIAAKLEDQKIKEWNIWGSPSISAP
jgi:tetratricopeptide (TPR) repeat protein